MVTVRRQKPKKQFIDRKTNQLVKVLRSSSKGSITEKTQLPRHGIRGHCTLCGWKFRAGGIISKKQLLSIEREQKEIHAQVHAEFLQNYSPKTMNDYVLPEKQTLQIERDSHAAEIPHNFIEQNTRQITTSATYVTVTGSTLTASNFTANQDHFVLVTAQADCSVNNRGVVLRVMRGSNPEPDSEAYLDAPLSTTSDTGHRMLYQWWGVINPSTAEDVRLQIRSSDGVATAAVDFITLTVIQLSPDLTVNTDYKHNFKAASTSISQEATDTDSLNNASVNITPGTSGNRWIIFSKARFGPGIGSNTGVNTRIKRSGQAATDVPELQQEGEDGTNSTYVLVGMRVDTLNAVSNTYEEVSKANNTDSANPGVAATRTHSGIFMLNLDKFRTVTVAQEDTPLEEITTTTDYGQLIHSASIAPAVTGDVLFLSHTTYSAAVSGTNVRFWKLRMQINNTDPQDLPTTTTNDITTKAYKLAQWDGADRLPIIYAAMENRNTSTHTIDVDGSLGEVDSNRGTHHRNIIAFSMEMVVGAVARTMVINDTMNISDAFRHVRGIQRTLLHNDTMTITDQAILKSSANSTLIQQAHFVMRLSGGVNNTDPKKSLGGPMSTVDNTTGITVSADYVATDYVTTDYVTESRVVFPDETGIINNISTLWDPVSQSESELGDTEYRLIYINNTHPTLTMFHVTLWIPQNTPAIDEIRLGPGAAATNADETPVADENTAPETVTFFDATSYETGVNIGHIGPGQKKGVWFRRLVPPNTPAREDNDYLVAGKFYSSASA